MKHTVIARMACALVFASFATGQDAHAQTWSAIDLGAVSATALNDAGQVVGHYTNASGALRAFSTDANGAGWHDLGTLGGSIAMAFGINNAGQIVGSSDTSAGVRTAFVTSASSTAPTSLGTFGGTYSSATSINNNGVVVINYDVQGKTNAASLNLSSSTLTNLTPGYLSGHYTLPGSASGRAVNDDGTIVGTLNNSCCTTAAYVFGRGSINVDSMALYSRLSAINNHDLVVGATELARFEGSSYMGTYTQAFAKALGTQTPTVLLGTLGGYSSEAFGVNNLGQIVGRSRTVDGIDHAFYTEANSMKLIDLNSLVTLDGGAYLTSASDVNDMGQLIALGSNGHSYLLSAVPEPSTWALGLLGALALILRARSRRIDGWATPVRLDANIGAN